MTQAHVQIGLVTSLPTGTYQTQVGYAAPVSDSIATIRLNPAAIPTASSAVATIVPAMELNGVPVTDMENQEVSIGTLQGVLIHLEAETGATASVLEVELTGILCDIGLPNSTARLHLTVGGGKAQTTFYCDSHIVPGTGHSIVLTHLSGPTTYKISLRLLGS